MEMEQHWSIINSHAYTRLNPNSHPNIASDGEHCANTGQRNVYGHLHGNGNYYWDHRSCTEHYPALCEYPLDSQPWNRCWCYSGFMIKCCDSVFFFIVRQGQYKLRFVIYLYIRLDCTESRNGNRLFRKCGCSISLMCKNYMRVKV